MKISAKQYSLSLYQAVENKKNSEVKDAIKKFIKVLIDNNDMLKTEEIIRQFRKIYNKKERIVEAEVVSARELDKKIVKLLNSYIIKLSDADKVELEQKIDKKVLGGVVIKYGDKILDGSLKTRLKEMKSKIIE